MNKNNGLPLSHRYALWGSLLDEDKNLKVEIHSVSGDAELKEQMQKA